MKVNKKLKRDILKAVIIAIVILIFLQPSLFPQPVQQITYQMRKVFFVDETEEPEPEVINQGIAMRAVIVDAQGNVIRELMASPLGGSPNTMTIVSLTGSTGYNKYCLPPSCTGDCIGCLALDTILDNTVGDSEVTINSVFADNRCSFDNPLYNEIECTGLPNIVGPGGSGYGDLISKWNTEIVLNGGITLPFGERYPESPDSVLSDPLDLSLIDVGLINFSILVVGTYKDAQGQDIPLVGAGGNLFMEVVNEVCSDGTPVDFDSGDADDGDGPDDIWDTPDDLCSRTNIGQYCRISAYGEPELTDRASICGCCVTGQPTNYGCGWEPIGDVCQPIGDCRDTWGDTSCEPGGVRYCDGGVVNYACSTCGGPGNCPKNANGEEAIGCSGTYPNSFCDYPSGTGDNFYVKFSPPDLGDLRIACGDGVKSGTEECDTNDLGGETCTTIPGGYTGGTLSCYPPAHAQECEYDKSSCTGGGGTFVQFRTTDLYYGAWTTDNTAIAFTDTCGNVLTGYGATISEGYHQNSLTCATYDWMDDCTPILGTPDCLLLGDVVGTTPSGGNGIWNLYQRDTSANQVIMCQNDLDGSGFTYTIYDSTDPDASSVSTSTSTESPSMEEECST